MDVLDILDSLVILMILACSFGPSCEVTGADKLVEMVHHLVWELRCEESNSRPSIKLISSLVGKGFKFCNKCVHFSWDEAKMMEFFFSMLCGASVLESLFESSGYSSAEVFICGWVPSIGLINSQVGPALDPDFDVFSLNEPQRKCGSFHGVVNLVCTYVGQAVGAEFIHKGVRFTAGAIKNSRGISPKFASSSSSSSCTRSG